MPNNAQGPRASLQACGATVGSADAGRGRLFATSRVAAVPEEEDNEEEERL